MKLWQAIPFACALALLSGYLGEGWVSFMVIITSAWAAIDAKELRTWEYKTSLPYKPIVLFALIVLLWIVAFPWYLNIRHKIKTGRAFRLPPIRLAAL